nr:DUF2339 domain-containing protein [Halanaerobacter jeridensis]
MLNKIGVLLILFGVIAGFKYSYSHWISRWVNNYVKGSFFFLLGGLFIGGGEWFYREDKQVFALGLLGGGISILYASVFYSYFLLEIINLVTAFLMMILISFTVVAASLRYNSKTICSLGLIGGYLTFITYAINYQLSGASLYGTMIYLLSLTAAVLTISFKKRWIILNYISFFANLPALLYLTGQVNSELLAIIYAGVTFIMYLAIILAYPLKHQMSLSIFDVSLLGVNTVVNSLLLYNLVLKAGLDNLAGIITLILGAIYWLLGKLVQQRIPNEKSTAFLFYGVAVILAVVLVPLQFGVKCLSLGWLIEALILIVYGHLKKIEVLEFSGILLLICSAFIFIKVDLIVGFFLGDVHYFSLKYLAFTLGQIVLLLLYLFDTKTDERNEDSQSRWWLNKFKYFVVIHTWIYLLYQSGKLYNNLVSTGANYYFYQSVVVALISIGYGQLIKRFKLIYDEFIKYFSLFLYLFGDAICIGINLTIPVFLKPQNMTLKWVSLLILIAYNIIVFFNFKELLTTVLKKKKFSLEWLSIILSIYLFGVITTFLAIQFRLGRHNLSFSIFYLILALAFISYGFKKKLIYQRRLGLGLALFATGKLFLYDLSLLSSGAKIVAYFVFGVVLLTISFIYQKMEEALENYEE